MRPFAELFRRHKSGNAGGGDIDTVPDGVKRRSAIMHRVEHVVPHRAIERAEVVEPPVFFRRLGGEPRIVWHAVELTDDELVALWRWPVGERTVPELEVMRDGSVRVWTGHVLNRQIDVKADDCLICEPEHSPHGIESTMPGEGLVVGE